MAAALARPLLPVLLLLALLAVASAWRLGKSLGSSRRQTARLQAAAATDSVPHAGLPSRAVLGRAAVAAPVLLASLLLPRVADARSSSSSYLKEATPDFVADKAKQEKFEAEGKKVRAVWDGLLAKLEAATTADELEATLREMRKLLVNMPYQIPLGAKKIDLVKTARNKKFLRPGSKSKKTKPEWATKVEIEYQALINQWNKNFNPDNRVEESIF